MDKKPGIPPGETCTSHEFICHNDGSFCREDGTCGELWCKCNPKHGTMGRRFGWLVCSFCRRPING